MRATVEVTATMETCVAAVVGWGDSGVVMGGYRVPMIVPSWEIASAYLKSSDE
jgi:hypothetical protein